MNVIVKLLLGAAGTLLLSVIRQLTEKHIMDRLVELAGMWVEKLAGDTSQTGAQKRAAAFRGIKADLTSLRISTTDSLIYLAIEISLNAWKAKQAERKPA